ncbi:hypothetical protein K488DRAFT_89801 [Vararia minispora EC-137]|uniref:Uncharacterized protein n=1 Tax=Vararia minispora EC-137 TaxID=1314806 RepID=A0ACB8Q9B8_9AGAM|nr:hypothetical protein K488DRAFT_89801 [Vararia minispora EC-137]
MAAEYHPLQSPLSAPPTLLPTTSSYDAFNSIGFTSLLLEYAERAQALHPSVARLWSLVLLSIGSKASGDETAAYCTDSELFSELLISAHNSIAESRWIDKPVFRVPPLVPKCCLEFGTYPIVDIRETNRYSDTIVPTVVFRDQQSYPPHAARRPLDIFWTDPTTFYLVSNKAHLEMVLHDWFARYNFGPDMRITKQPATTAFDAEIKRLLLLNIFTVAHDQSRARFRGTYLASLTRNYFPGEPDVEQSFKQCAKDIHKVTVKGTLDAINPDVERFQRARTRGGEILLWRVDLHFVCADPDFIARLSRSSSAS